MDIRRALARPDLRPFAILLAAVAALAIADQGGGRFLSLGTVSSVMQQFATLGLVALGLGLSMVIREFDISVAGMFSLAGVVGVLAGAQDPWLGVLAAVAVGLIGGMLQGLIMVWLRLSSVGVTLGGLLTFGGVAHVITGSKNIIFPDMEAALAVNEPVFGVLSIRSLVALAVFVVAAFVIGYTRYGRDVIAMGSDRRASVVAGVNTDRLLIVVFAISGMLAALAGVLLSYSLATASPVGLAEVLVPATAAAILGGVSLSGGTGRPLGIAAGVLILGLLRSGLHSLGASPFVHDIATGSVLLLVAILDGPHLMRRVAWVKSRVRPAE